MLSPCLGIEDVRTSAYGWSAAAEGGRGAQIDLVLARGDRTVNICEMKYINGEFVIDADYEKELRNKVDAYQRETGTENRVFDYANLRYANLRKLYIALFAGFCYNIVT